MTKRGTILLSMVYLMLLACAGGASVYLDRELSRADRERAREILDEASTGVRDQAELAIVSGHTGNAEQLIETIVEAQPRLAVRLEAHGHRTPKVYGVWPQSEDSLQAVYMLGAEHESPPLAYLSFRIDPVTPMSTARTLLIVLALVGPIAGFAIASIHTRERHLRAMDELRGVFSGRVDTLRETRGREIGPGRLDPDLEGKFEDLASQIATMAAYKEFFTNALQSMVDSLLIVNAEGVMLAVNQAAVDTLGYTEEELLGQNVSMIWADEKGLVLTGDRLSKILADGARNDLALSFRTRHGNKVPINLSGSAIRSRTGEVTGFVCIATDVTERRRAEKEKERLNRELVDTSRRAGMAEVATGVLHNVGNVLNSVTVTASSINTLVGGSRVSRLGQIVEMLESHADDLGGFLTEDPKGSKIPKYLAALAVSLREEHTTLLSEIEELNKNVEHIKKVITVQQRVARVSGVSEPVDASELLEDAVRIRESSFGKHGIRLIRNYSLNKPINTDKHKVLQILVNLVGNAIDAMSGHTVNGEPGRRILSLTVMRSRENSEFAEISVADTGPGIAESNLTRIFTHGFTTKKEGHGFGLHSAAIAAKEMGGSLTCRNRDHGTGAIFTLRLPIEMKETQRERTEAAA
ncbi:MAG: nitrogen regulation protein NR(II) [Phycisphaerales bacterium JB040]